MVRLRSGPLIALLAAALFGLSIPLSKALLAGVDPWMLAGLLYLGSGLSLSVLLAIRRFASPITRETPLVWKDVPWLAGTVAFGGIAGPILLMFGLAHSDAASSALLLNLEAVLTLAMAWIVFGEHVDRRLFMGAVAIVAGALLLSWTGSRGVFGAGTLLIAAACFCWAIDNNLTRTISTRDPVVLAAIKGLVAGATNTSLALYAGSAWPPLGSLLLAMMLGAVSYGLGLVLFIIALRLVGTARTGAYYGTAPFIGAMASVLFFGQAPTVQLAAAGALMAVGAWLHLSERHGHEHVHEALDHSHSHTHDAHHQHEHEADDPPGEPHAHPHRHKPLRHSHQHYPDVHHRHTHSTTR